MTSFLRWIFSPELSALYIKTARHALPYVTRPSAAELDEAFQQFKNSPTNETRNAFLLMAQRYSLSKHRHNDDLALRVRPPLTDGDGVLGEVHKRCHY